MKQNILKFNFKFKSNDFFVTEKNMFAYNFIKMWPNWQQHSVYLYGPEKCGKTTISQMWLEVSKGIYVSSENFEDFITDDLNIEYIKSNNWLIDDVDDLIAMDKNLNSSKILNLINIIKDSKDSFLLMTAKKSPKQIDCDLNDLISRFLSCIVLEVRNPDQELLLKIINKYLNDRNIYLSQKKLKFIANRIERSYESAIEIAKKIDLKSLETKSNISIHFLKSNLKI
mgnify:FL=1